MLVCLLGIHYIKRRMFKDYQGNKPELDKHYLDDVPGISSGTPQDLEEFIHFCSTYHPSLKYTFEISKSSIPFLDLCLSTSDDRMTTTIHYKPTNTHSYLDYSPSHPPHCKNTIPYSQFLHLQKIYFKNNDFEAKSKEMALFFERRGHPHSVITTSQKTSTQELWLI